MKPVWPTVLMAALLAGCNKEREVSMAESAGSAVGETVTDFATGVGEGVDKRMKVEVELSPQSAEAGLSTTVAKSLGLKRGITVYFLSEKPFAGTMVAKAVNMAGDEIGRATVEVEFDADDAQYINFSFAPEMDSQLVEKYLVDIRTKGTENSETASSDSKHHPTDR